MNYDVIILGSGPAGLTAALYCARAGKSTLVLGGTELGGQMATIPMLENYPGWTGSGAELAEFMKNQAEQFGAKVIFADAKHAGVHKTSPGDFEVVADNGEIFTAGAVIAATGASPRKLEIKGAREFLGKGVSYCATCDGFFYTGKDVLVIGGGNSALNDALYLANVAKTVTIVYRKGSFARAEKILIDRINATKNISVEWNTELAEIAETDAGARGDDTLVNDFVVKTTDGREIFCDGIFVAIGHEANTDYLAEEYKRDHLGRLIQQELPAGLFVCGDVKSALKMQVATAVGTGCEAAMDAVGYLNSKK